MRPIRIATVSFTLLLLFVTLAALAPVAQAESCNGLISLSLGPGCSPIIQIGSDDAEPDSSACAAEGCVAVRAPKSEPEPATVARRPARKPAARPAIHRPVARPQAPVTPPRANWLDDAREFYTGSYDLRLPYDITPPRTGVTKWLAQSPNDPLPGRRGFDFTTLTTDPRAITSLIVGIMFVLGAGRVRRLLLHP